MKTIIIGDVHGCADALDALLNKIRPKSDDTLVFLGDLFDRGPDSWEVFQTVQALEKTFGERFILLRGNHEDYLMQKKLPLMQRLVWARVGRGATAKSFKAHGARMEDAVPWLKAHTRLYWKGPGVQCVHAGLMVEPIEMNAPQTMIADHEIAQRNTYRGPLTVVGHIALSAPTWFAGDGQTTRTLPWGKKLPLPATGTLCIDTGSGKGGVLTAMLVRDGQFILVR